MTRDDAISLIQGAVTTKGGTWADLGAGSGTFSRALASLLGRGGVVYAVDRNAAALHELDRVAAHAQPDVAEIRTVVGDFERALVLPELDGVVVANALHFVPYERQAAVLASLADIVRPRGPVVVVEYDRRRADRWVPYPVGQRAFASVAREAGLGDPLLLGTRPSRYSGTIYSVAVRREHDD